MRVADLDGMALDLLVARALGLLERDVDVRVHGTTGELWLYDQRKDGPACSYSPSTDWCDGGPIIEREKITLSANRTPAVGWDAWIYDSATPAVNAPTPLLAAMRYFVASKFGPEVPD